MRRRIPLIPLIAAAVLGALTIARAECEPPAATAPIPAIALRPIVSGFASPLHFAQSPDGRVFVVEQAGRIREIRQKQIVEPPYLDIRERIESGGEKGLLSVAFHPGFTGNGRLFLNSTRRENDKLKTLVTELRATPDFSRADPATERVLLKIKQPFDNHNGGQIAFGPEGFLYVGMGDGGGGNDPSGNAQNPAVRLGKMLRIDVDRTSGNKAFAIPADNPFTGISGFHPAIWALGFRNPYRFGFDAATGELYAGDVGQGAREEIDLVVRGGNYGWNVLEGTLCTPGVSDPDCDTSGFVSPIAEYDHDGGGCAVSGGFVYRGAKVPGLCGAYLYGDFCTGEVFALRQSGGRRTAGPVRLLDTDLRASSFGITRKGELRVVDYGGTIYKLVAP